MPSTGGEGLAPALSHVDSEDGSDNEPAGEQGQQEGNQQDEQADEEDRDLTGPRACAQARSSTAGMSQKK